MEKISEKNLLYPSVKLRLSVRAFVFTTYFAVSIIAALTFLYMEKATTENTGKVILEILTVFAPVISAMYFAFFDLYDYIKARQYYYQVSVSQYFVGRRLELSKSIEYIYKSWYRNSFSTPLCIVCDISSKSIYYYNYRKAS